MLSDILEGLLPGAARALRETIKDLPNIRASFRRSLIITTKNKRNENYWCIAIKSPQTPLLDIRSKLLVTNNTSDTIYIQNAKLQKYDDYLQTIVITSDSPPEIEYDDNFRPTYSETNPIPSKQTRYVTISFQIEERKLFDHSNQLHLMHTSPTLDNISKELKRDYVIFQPTPGKVPEAIYFVDCYSGISRITKLDFFYEKDMTSLLNSLYPNEPNYIYPKITLLSLEKKQQIALHTGHPFTENPKAPLKLDVILTNSFGDSYKSKGLTFYSTDELRTK